MDTRMKVVVTFAAIFNAVLVVLVANQVIAVREEVRGLRQVLATKHDLAALRPTRLTEPLEARCTTCHSERRFAGRHDEAPAAAVIRRMQAQPGARIGGPEVERIHASLTLLQCARCHSGDVLDRLTLKPAAERARIVREMQKKPGSGIRPDQVQDIVRSYDMLLGY
jgi:hypothetical protein